MTFFPAGFYMSLHLAASLGDISKFQLVHISVESFKDSQILSDWRVIVALQILQYALKHKMCSELRHSLNNEDAHEESHHAQVWISTLGRYRLLGEWLWATKSQKQHPKKQCLSWLTSVYLMECRLPPFLCRLSRPWGPQPYEPPSKHAMKKRRFGRQLC